MKILFLDHDGVICLEEQWGSRYHKQKSIGGRKTGQSVRDLEVNYRFDDFDEESLKVLNKIIDTTDCEIVVSSDWRALATVEEMGNYYESQGIIKRPIGFTPLKKDLPKGLKYRYRDSVLEETRCYEVLQWLSNNPDVKQWVAVDDMDMGKFHLDYDGTYERDWGLTNFVRTFMFQGITEEGLYDKIIEHLT